jgi:hypothetical protein
MISPLERRWSIFLLQAAALEAAGSKESMVEAAALVKCKKALLLCLLATACFALSALEVSVLLKARELMARVQLLVLPMEVQIQ